MFHVLLASRNKLKVDEMACLLRDLNLDLTDLSRYPDAPTIEQSRTALNTNALAKAKAHSRAAGRWAIAESNGLIVPSLGLVPYSPLQSEGSDIDGLLATLAMKTGTDRAACYVSALALCDPQGNAIANFVGGCHGFVAAEPRGQSGFSFEPVFFVPAYGKTFAELSQAEKCAVGHRGRAFEQLREVIRRTRA